MAILKPDSTVLSNSILHSNSVDLDISLIGGSTNNVVRVLSSDNSGNLLFTDVSPLTIYEFYQIKFQGETAGYVSGGTYHQSTIDKFLFATSYSVGDVGELSVARYWLSGQSSSSDGYSFGGSTGPSTGNTTIDKFPFSSDTSATSIALTYGTGTIGTAAQSSSTHGYATGFGYIQKFSFSSDSNAQYVSSFNRRYGAGQTSSTHGYTSGGTTTNGFADGSTIDKFPFSSDTSATDVGEVLVARFYHSAQSSETHGYNAAGYNFNAGSYTGHFEKLSFASDSNGVGVSGLIGGAREGASGQSEVSYGYVSGGFSNSGSFTTIEKFPFSSDTNSTDVAELTQARSATAGHQI